MSRPNSRRLRWYDLIQHRMLGQIFIQFVCVVAVVLVLVAVVVVFVAVVLVIPFGLLFLLLVLAIAMTPMTLLPSYHKLPTFTRHF